MTLATSTNALSHPPSNLILSKVLNNFKTLLPPLATANEKIDGALSSISKVGSIAGCIATAANVIASLGQTADKVARWTTPLFLVGIGLRIAGVIRTTKSLIETHIFSRQFTKFGCLKKKVEEYTAQDFFNAINHLLEKSKNEKSFIKKHFGVDSKLLSKRLEKVTFKAEQIFVSDNSEKKSKYLNKLKNIAVLLDKRMTVMKLSKSFSITASLVNIGAAISLIFLPAAPAGLGIMGGVTLLELGHHYKMMKLKKQFEKEMKFT